MYIEWCPVFLQKMLMNFSSLTHGYNLARSRWCLLSSPYIHLGKKNNYTYFVHIWTNSRNNTCFEKTSSLAYASHKLELKLSFRCPTEGCSNNWAFLQKLANLTITLFKSKLCIGLSAYLSVFGDLHQGERFQCIESRRRKKTCCFLPWYLQMPSL